MNPRREFKAVLLDAGGTILTVTRNRYERIEAALRRRGFDVSRERIAEADAWIKEKLLKEPARRGEDTWVSTPEQEERFWDAYYRLMVRSLELPTEDEASLARALWDETHWVRWTVAYPDVEPVLRILKKHYRLGVVSNAFPSMRDAIAFTGLDPYMDVVVLSAEVRTAKPDPFIYRTALRRLGVQAHQALFVDDLEENVEGARSLGIEALLIDRSREKSGSHVIADLYDLLGFLGIPAPKSGGDGTHSRPS